MGQAFAQRGQDAGQGGPEGVAGGEPVGEPCGQGHRSLEDRAVEGGRLLGGYEGVGAEAPGPIRRQPRFGGQVRETPQGVGGGPAHGLDGADGVVQHVLGQWGAPAETFVPDLGRAGGVGAVGPQPGRFGGQQGGHDGPQGGAVEGSEVVLGHAGVGRLHSDGLERRGGHVRALVVDLRHPGEDHPGRGRGDPGEPGELLGGLGAPGRGAALGQFGAEGGDPAGRPGRFRDEGLFGHQGEGRGCLEAAGGVVVDRAVVPAPDLVVAVLADEPVPGVGEDEELAAAQTEHGPLRVRGAGAVEGVGFEGQVDAAPVAGVQLGQSLGVQFAEEDVQGLPVLLHGGLAGRPERQYGGQLGQGHRVQVLQRPVPGGRLPRGAGGGGLGQVLHRLGQEVRQAEEVVLEVVVPARVAFGEADAVQRGGEQGVAERGPGFLRGGAPDRRVQPGQGGVQGARLLGGVPDQTGDAPAQGLVADLRQQGAHGGEHRVPVLCGACGRLRQGRGQQGRRGVVADPAQCGGALRVAGAEQGPVAQGRQQRGAGGEGPGRLVAVDVGEHRAFGVPQLEVGRPSHDGHDPVGAGEDQRVLRASAHARGDDDGAASQVLAPSCAVGQRENPPAEDTVHRGGHRSRGDGGGGQQPGGAEGAALRRGAQPLPEPVRLVALPHRAGGRVVGEPGTVCLVGPVPDPDPVRRAVADHGPSVRHVGVSPPQHAASGGPAAPGEREGGAAHAVGSALLVRVAGIRGADVAVDLRGRGGAGVGGVPVAVGAGEAGGGESLPEDEEPAVHVAGLGARALRGRREAHLVAEDRALGSDHPGAAVAEDDQVRPCLAHKGAPRVLGRRGCADRLLPGGPAQFVEDPGPQGAGEARRHAGAQGVPHLLLGGGEDLARQPRQRLERAVVGGELAEVAGEIPAADTGDPFGEHRSSARRLGQPGHGAPVDALAFVAGAAAPEGRAEAAVGGEGQQVAPLVAGRPFLQAQAGALLGVADRDAQGEELVEEVDVADGGPQGAALGVQFGAQGVGETVDERVQLGRCEAPVVGAAQVEEPARPAGRAVRGPRLGGQPGVAQSLGRAGLLQQAEPLAQVVLLPALGQQPQQGAADAGFAPGQFPQGGQVGLPPAGRCLEGARQRQHLAQVGHLLGERVLARGGLRQPAQVARAGARRCHAVRGEPDEQPAQVPEGGGGRHPGRQPLGVGGEHLGRHGVGEGELQEHGIHAGLVERQGVGRLGLARVDEHLGGVRLLARGQEHPAGLLVEGGQEVRHRAREALTGRLVGGAGPLRTGAHRPGDLVHLLDQGHREMAVGGVADQHPFGEAHRPVLSDPDLDRFARRPQAEESAAAPGGLLGGRVLGRQAYDDPVVQARVPVGAGEHGHGAVACPGGARRQYGSRAQQFLHLCDRPVRGRAVAHDRLPFSGVRAWGAFTGRRPWARCGRRAGRRPCACPRTRRRGRPRSAGACRDRPRGARSGGRSTPSPRCRGRSCRHVR